MIRRFFSLFKRRVKGVCPNCRQKVRLGPNEKLLKPELREEIELVIEKVGIGPCGRFWTRPHKIRKRGTWHWDPCPGEKRCPTSLVGRRA